MTADISAMSTNVDSFALSTNVDNSGLSTFVDKVTSLRCRTTLCQQLADPTHDDIPRA